MSCFVPTNSFCTEQQSAVTAAWLHFLSTGVEVPLNRSSSGHACKSANNVQIAFVKCTVELKLHLAFYATGYIPRSSSCAVDALDSTTLKSAYSS
jgi:hypothetical protein